jgi:hypothetical protein
MILVSYVPGLRAFALVVPTLIGLHRCLLLYAGKLVADGRRSSAHVFVDFRVFACVEVDVAPGFNTAFDNLIPSVDHTFVAHTLCRSFPLYIIPFVNHFIRRSGFRAI